MGFREDYYAGINIDERKVVLVKRKRKILDELDLMIIKELQKDSSQSLSEIASRINAPVSTVFSRVKKMREEGVIRGFTAVINPVVLGYNVTAIIMFSVEGAYVEDIEKQLAPNPNIIALYDTTGEYDIIAIARFKSISELDRFIKSVLKNPRIKKTITSVVLRVVKENFSGVPDRIE